MATHRQVTAPARAVNPDALNAMLGRAVQDMGAALQAPLILIGDKLGLVPGDGRWSAGDSGGAGEEDGDVGEICSRVVECECGGAAGAV